MADRVQRMIWCSACLAENWGEMYWLVEGKQATWRSGTLQLRAWCRSCDAELLPGTGAEAVTVHYGRADEAGWERGYFEADSAVREGV